MRGSHYPNNNLHYDYTGNFYTYDQNGYYLIYSPVYMNGYPLTNENGNFIYTNGYYAIDQLEQPFYVSNYYIKDHYNYFHFLSASFCYLQPYQNQSIENTPQNQSNIKLSPMYEHEFKKDQSNITLSPNEDKSKEDLGKKACANRCFFTHMLKFTKTNNKTLLNKLSKIEEELTPIGNPNRLSPERYDINILEKINQLEKNSTFKKNSRIQQSIFAIRDGISSSKIKNDTPALPLDLIKLACHFILERSKTDALDYGKTNHRLALALSDILDPDVFYTDDQRFILLTHCINKEIEENKGWFGMDKYKRYGQALQNIKNYLTRKEWNKPFFNNEYSANWISWKENKNILRPLNLLPKKSSSSIP